MGGAVARGGTSTLSPAPRQAVVIINPIAGTGRRPRLARARVELAERLLSRHGLAGAVFVTEGAGHARALAARAVADGLGLVVAWGGDGTVNEVASALAFHDAALAVVPAGSGNGLARELGVSFDPARALETAFAGSERRLDAGEIDGRLFFNVAGIGLDARIAHRFAAGGLRRRGLARYLTSTVREIAAFEPEEHTIVTDAGAARVRALLVAIANTRQYGNGAVIAPYARFDDGRLDVVTVAYRSRWQVLRAAPRLFTGGLDRLPGVTMATAAAVEVRASRPLCYHVDGEPCLGGASLAARVHAGALRVRAPDAGGAAIGGSGRAGSR